MYGPDVARSRARFAQHRPCMARRLVERGVRFVQIYHSSWDHHGNLPAACPTSASDVDQPCWALIHDLKRHGPARLARW